jgi:hypothetical protein
VFAQKYSCRIVHFADIEPTCFVMRVTQPKRRYYGSIDDAINVSFDFRGKPRVKIVVAFFNLQNTHVAPDIAVDCAAQSVGREMPVQAYIGDLTFGVNARVRSAGADDFNFRVFEHSDDSFKLALHSALIFLHLPAVKIRAVVLYEKFKIHF